jgi:signal transduction histidine kinase/ligand-binding sensor domain-containing protein
MFALAVLAIAAVLFGRADAIDPSRTLSQALLRKWQVQQGLPQATIFSIRQTADGYLWLGSQTGLIRFDGQRFTMMKDNQYGLLENAWIEDLCEDADHNLWIATDGAGLIRLRRGECVRFGPADGMPWDAIRCLHSDRNGGLWVGAAAGLGRIKSGKFEVIVSPEQNAGRGVRAITQTPDGTIWFGGNGSQLGAFHNGELASHSLESLPSSGSVRALLSTADGVLWAGTTHGLVRLDEGREQCFTRADGLADDWVCCLAAGGHDVVWAGTKDGFSRIRGRDIESFRTRDGLSQSTVYALCEDHEGSLWAGTKHGLNQFLDRRTIPFTASEGLPINDTGPVFQDQGGTIWVGTLGAGLARFDGRRFSSVVTAQQGLVSNSILALCGGEENGLWIGTNRGLCRMGGDRIDATYAREQGLPGNVIRCLCRDPQGTLWAGTDAGVAALDGYRFAPPQGAPPELQAPILAMADCRGSLIVATEGGAVFRRTDGKFSRLSMLDSTSHDVVALYCDAEGLLWLGSRGGGLMLVDLAGRRLGKNGVFRYSLRDGLYDDDIFGIVADNDDRLWMACSKGIFSIARDELLSFASGALPNVTSTPFSPTDALRTIECQDGIQPAVWKMQDGRIWFSTIRGLIVIDPEHLQRTLPVAALTVEEVKVNGKQEPLEALDHLPPGTTNLDFRYTALSFVSPTRIAFRYQLEGFDRDWVEAGGRREAFYTNLPPGAYRFRVMARNVDGAWREAPQSIGVYIAPHYYQTRWFWPLVVVLAIAAGWSAYRLRVRRIKSQMNAVVAERSRIARELHDTLMQGFSGITMEMQALVARLSPSRDRSALEDIIRDAGACLREARRSIAGLRSAPGEETGLAAAVAQAARQLTETHDVKLKLRLATDIPRLPPDVEYNLLRIAQEAIANAVKHSAAHTIEVLMEVAQQRLRISISDDGTGFRRTEVDPAQSGHYGLIGMRERANQLGADFLVASEAGSGTTVRVELPLNLVGNGNAPQFLGGELSALQDREAHGAAPRRAAERIE